MIGHPTIAVLPSRLPNLLTSAAKMSAGNFDILSQLWAASLAPYNDAPPFASHSDLCKMIDSMPIGGIEASLSLTTG